MDVIKQRIDPAQLNELSPEQKELLRKWWKPQKSDIAVVVNPETELYERFRGIELVVDDMIDCKYNRIDFYASPSHYGTPTLYRGVPMFHKQDCLPLLSIGQMIELISQIEKDSLCDALWKAVRAILKGAID